MLTLSHKYDFSYPEDKFNKLSKAVKNSIDDKAQYMDWNTCNEIKAELIVLLDQWVCPPIDRDEVYKETFNQAEQFKKSRELGYGWTTK